MPRNIVIKIFKYTVLREWGSSGEDVLVIKKDHTMLVCCCYCIILERHGLLVVVDNHHNIQQDRRYSDPKTRNGQKIPQKIPEKKFP